MQKVQGKYQEEINAMKQKNESQKEDGSTNVVEKNDDMIYEIKREMYKMEAELRRVQMDNQVLRDSDVVKR